MRKCVSKKTLKKLYDELVIDHSNLTNDYNDMADRKDTRITFLEVELEKEKAKNVVLKKENEFLRKQEKVKQTSPLEIAKKARAGWYGE
ncbi:MAG TPA: hypothetical protein PL042_06795 [Caldisericia bacterium]|nr:hypothetical protein [Caldisericia bacterium]